MLSKMSERKRQILYDLTYMWDLKEGLTETQSRWAAAKGRVGGWGGWKVGENG